MKKIPTIFDRDWEGDRKVIDKPNPECDWVFRGEGIATEKVDGTNIKVRVESHKITKVWKRKNPNKKYKRKTIKEITARCNENKTEEDELMPLCSSEIYCEKCKQEIDKLLTPTYVLAERDDPPNKHIFKCVGNVNATWDSYAWDNFKHVTFEDGEYPCEAYGTNIQGNPLGEDPNIYFFSIFPSVYEDVSRDYLSLKKLLMSIDSFVASSVIRRKPEGIVFHHPDGRMAKIKRKDFNFTEGMG